MSSTLKGSVLILGNPGSGKSTFARAMSRRTALPIIELDALFWGPYWKKKDPQIVNDFLIEKLALEHHIIEGQYPIMKNEIANFANTIIVLDLAFPLLFARIFIRSFKRIITREVLWNGNRENVRMLFSRQSMLFYICQVFDINRQDNIEIIKIAKAKGKNVYIFKNTRDITKFLRGL